MNNVLLTMSQTAEYLGVSEDTLRNWDKSGELVPDFKTKGNHRRYSITQLNEYKSVPKIKRDFLKSHGERWYIREFDYYIEELSDYVVRNHGINEEFWECGEENGYWYRTYQDAIEESKKILKILGKYTPEREVHFNELVIYFNDKYNKA